jgi:hypothetical protein
VEQAAGAWKTYSLIDSLEVQDNFAMILISNRLLFGCMEWKQHERSAAEIFQFLTATRLIETNSDTGHSNLGNGSQRLLRPSIGNCAPFAGLIV